MTTSSQHLIPESHIVRGKNHNAGQTILPAMRPSGSRNWWTVTIVLAVGTISVMWWFEPQQLKLLRCSLYGATGLHCPACGASRATHAILHGRWQEALHYNALWVISIPLVFYVAISEIRVVGGARPLPGDLIRRAWFWFVVIAVGLLFFVLRNLPWYPLMLLAPTG
ncbi:MAG: DUF2752 domain-containing protein [Planctomycetota bacterium]|nr:DUF2752 domain-containing protein [Planctomycetota bacterium]